MYRVKRRSHLAQRAAAGYRADLGAAMRQMNESVEDNFGGES